MKKKKIIILILAFIVVITTISINKSDNYNIVHDGAILAITLDGKTITSFPERGRYGVSVDCGDTARGVWLVDDWKLAVEDIEGNAKCNIAFSSNPITLKNEVEKDELTLRVGTPNYDTATTLSKDDYGTPEIFYSSENISAQGATGTNASNSFTYSETSWKSGGVLPGKYYYFRMHLPFGHYNLCYQLSGAGTAKVSRGTLTLSSIDSSSGMRCINLENVKDFVDNYSNYREDPIAIIFKTGTSSDKIGTLEFYVQKVKDMEYDAGYRYIGGNPNNYVWFNNEKWRIIGSIPTKLSDGTEANLIKLIRNESIGGLVYNSANSNTTWGSNTLYTLLNTKYFGKLDATGSSLCLGYGTSNNALCNYEVIGISNSNTDYYGRMLENVYWNVGTYSYSLPSSEEGVLALYKAEVDAISTNVGKVGLMNISDYAYNKLFEYYSWLYAIGEEWTLTPYSASQMNVCGGESYRHDASLGNAVRPVVYLDPSVYIVSGDGTEGNPYQIAM